MTNRKFNNNTTRLRAFIDATSYLYFWKNSEPDESKDAKITLEEFKAYASEDSAADDGSDLALETAPALDNNSTVLFKSPTGWFKDTIANIRAVLSTAVEWLDFTEQSPAPTANDYRLYADANRKMLAYFRKGRSVADYIGTTQILPIKNATGATLVKGSPVSVIGLDLVNGLVSVALTDSTDRNSSQLFAGIVEEDVIDGETGFALRFAFLSSYNTSSWDVGQELYVDPVNCCITNVKPSAPDYTLFIGAVAVKDELAGIVSVGIQTLSDNDTAVNIEGTLNGLCTQTPDVQFSVTGGVIYADVINEEYTTKELPFMLSGKRYFLNTTSNTGIGGAARIIVPPGASDILKQKSYIYVTLNGSNAELAVSTSKPSAPHAMICTVVAYNATRTTADGKVFGYRRHNDASDSKTEGIEGSYGMTRVLTDDSRSRGSAWDSGQSGTAIVDNSNIKLSLTAGVGKQLHYANTPLFDGNNYQVYNDISNSIVYSDETNLINITTDASGNSLLSNGNYYRFRFYYKINSNGLGNDIIVTRPLGGYSSPELVEADSLKYTVSLADTDIEDIVYPLYDMIIYRSGGGGTTVSLHKLISLRSKTPGVGGGSGGESAGTDDKIRISASDTINDYLQSKLIEGNGISLEVVNPGGNEQIKINGNTIKLTITGVNADATYSDFFPVGYFLEKMLVTNTTANNSSSPEFTNNSTQSYFAAPIAFETANTTTVCTLNPGVTGLKDDYFYQGFSYSPLFKETSNDLVVSSPAWNNASYDMIFYLTKMI